MVVWGGLAADGSTYLADLFYYMPGLLNSFDALIHRPKEQIHTRTYHHQTHLLVANVIRVQYITTPFYLLLVDGTLLVR